MYACKQHPVEAIGPVPEAHLVRSIKGKCLTVELDGKQLETIGHQEAVLEHNRFLVLNAGSLRYGLCRIRQNSCQAIRRQPDPLERPRFGLLYRGMRRM